MLGLLVLVLGLTSWPYLQAELECPPDRVTTGLVGPYANDQAFYLSWGPRQAQDGHLLFEDKFNGHAERRVVFNPLWLAMGGLARLPGGSVTLAFQVVRVLGGALLLLAAYDWSRRFLPGPGWRLWALAMLSLSSGLGAWRLPVSEWGSGRGFQSLPVDSITPDLWVVESNVFLTLLGEGVLPVATGLLLLSLRAGLDALGGSSRQAARAGGIVLLLGSVYPYAVISAWSILGAAAAWRITEGWSWRSVAARYALLVTVSAPIVAYDFYLIWFDPRLTVGQALYASPSPLQYAQGLGALAALGLWGAVQVWRGSDREARWLVVWLTATLVQIYLPMALVPFQLQLVLGIQVPLAILSARALAAAWSRLPPAGSGLLHRAPAGLALAAVTAFSCGTSAFHWLDAESGLRRRDLPEYLQSDVSAALRWLDQQAGDEQLVLAAPRLAPFVSLVAGTRMYTADYQAPTADFPRKDAFVKALVSADPNRSGASLVQALRTERIDFVLCDPELRRLGGEGVDQRLEALPGLQQVFRNPSVSVYSVRPLRTSSQSSTSAPHSEAASPIRKARAS